MIQTLPQLPPIIVCDDHAVPADDGRLLIPVSLVAMVYEQDLDDLMSRFDGDTRRIAEWFSEAVGTAVKGISKVRTR